MSVMEGFIHCTRVAELEVKYPILIFTKFLTLLYKISDSGLAKISDSLTPGNEIWLLK